MPKKKNPETQTDQSERFRKAIVDMVAAGELSPAEADDAFETLMSKIKAEKVVRDENC